MADIPINRDVLPRPTEQSRLLSPHESTSLPRLWKAVSAQSQVAGQLRNAIGQQGRQIQAINQSMRSQSGSGMFPFRIYQFPSYLRKFQNDNDWQRFKVRSGGSPYSASPDVSIVGTDAEPYPYQDTFLTTEVSPSDNTQIGDDWHEIVVPADGTVYYFWISTVTRTGGSPWTLMFGADPASATSMGDGTTGIDDKWTQFPLNDPYHYMVGSVAISPTATANGHTSIGGNVPVVNQALGENLYCVRSSFSGATGLYESGYYQVQYCGDYDATEPYFFQNQVTKDAAGPGAATIIRTLYSYTPPSGTAFLPFAGPIIGIDPATNNPDPWRIVSRSLLQGDWATGAYDASKYYLRTT